MREGEREGSREWKELYQGKQGIRRANGWMDRAGYTPIQTLSSEGAQSLPLRLTLPPTRVHPTPTYLFASCMKRAPPRPLITVQFSNLHVTGEGGTT